MDNIMSNVIHLMKEIETNKNLTGKEKKQYVLNKLRDILQLNDNIENLIIDIIDYVILLDKNVIKINPKLKKCKGCFKF